MSEQVPALQRPANNDKVAWKTYWMQQGQPWRKEPEIDVERQKYLAEQRAITPDIEQGIYPFKEIKLSRADVEWLLATHENGRGPVNWSDVSQRGREGLDLRGADLEEIDLQGLPLTRIRCSLTKDEQPPASEMQCIMARARMQKAVLAGTQLQGAHLHHVHLDEAFLMEAKLDEADLTEARLEGANLSGGQLQRADLSRAKLEEGSLYEAQLQGTIFRSARLERVDLRSALLQGADLRDAVLLGAFLEKVNFCGEEHVSPLFADVEWSNAKIDSLDQGVCLLQNYISRLGQARMVQCGLEG